MHSRDFLGPFQRCPSGNGRTLEDSGTPTVALTIQTLFISVKESSAFKLILSCKTSGRQSLQRLWLYDHGGKKVSIRDAISTCWRSWGEENICFFSSSSQNNNKWGRDKGLKTFIISIGGVVLLPLTSIWHKKVMESGFPLDPVSSYAEKKDWKCSNIQRMSWNIFWLWGRALIRLLSHQPLAQTAGRLFGRWLLFFVKALSIGLSLLWEAIVWNGIFQ